MKVTSRKTISFPKFNWGINKGKERELPKDRKMQETIMAHPAISESKKEKSTSTVEGEDKKSGESNK